MTLVSQIEAILFVVGEEGIGLEELAYLLEKSTAKTYEELTKLKEHYASDNKSALNILEVGNHFVLTTKKKYASLLKKICAIAYVERLITSGARNIIHYCL